jgi:hypothetical protein
VLIVVSVEKANDLLDSFNKIFDEKLSIKNPDNKDREQIIKWVIS